MDPILFELLKTVQHSFVCMGSLYQDIMEGLLKCEYQRGNMLGLEFYYHHNKHNKLCYLLLVLLHHTFWN